MKTLIESDCDIIDIVLYLAYCFFNNNRNSIITNVYITMIWKVQTKKGRKKANLTANQTYFRNYVCLFVRFASFIISILRGCDTAVKLYL